jgi:opacity protein-like surface antigen
MKLRTIVLCTILLSIPSLHSQDLLYGLHAGVNISQGDVKKDLNLTTGFNLGTNLFINLGHGHAIAPRLDYVTFSGKSFPNGTVTTLDAPGPSITYPVYGKGKFESIALIADYNFFPNGKANDGFYFALGVGFARNTYSLKETTDPKVQINWNNSDSMNSVIVNAGFGYMFSPHIGVEAKYAFTRYEMGSPNFVNQSNIADAPWVNLGLVARF